MLTPASNAAAAAAPTVWFTGLSSAGKTTLCREVARQLEAFGRRCEVLDGDVLRQQICAGLGFSRADRDENVRRIAYVASLLARHGVLVLVAAISPYREARASARRVAPGAFVEVYVNAPLTLCEQRDVKGLYRRARAGGLAGFTGIDDPYEAPLAAEVECRTDVETLAESAAKVLAAIRLADHEGSGGLGAVGGFRVLAAGVAAAAGSGRR